MNGDAVTRESGMGIHLQKGAKVNVALMNANAQSRLGGVRSFWRSCSVDIDVTRVDWIGGCSLSFFLKAHVTNVPSQVPITRTQSQSMGGGPHSSIPLFHRFLRSPAARTAWAWLHLYCSKFDNCLSGDGVRHVMI